MRRSFSRAAWLAAGGALLAACATESGPSSSSGGGEMRAPQSGGTTVTSASTSTAAAVPAPAAPAPATSQPPKPEVKPEPIVIDNHDAAGRFTTKGAWNVDEAGGDWAGTPCHWTTPNGEASARWEAKITKSGKWKVFVWYGDDPVNDHATDAAYTVEHGDGTDTVKLNQKTNQRQWNLLGSYRFDAAKPAAVVLTNKANSNVIADGVKFQME